MRAALTTIDNPFNPLTQFDDWFAYDEQAGYHTCALLGRIAMTSSQLSDADYEAEVNDAIDRIVRLNMNGKYRKIVEQSS